MFVIKFDNTWFKLFDTTSFRFTDNRKEATVFNDYAHAESVVTSMAKAGITRLTICVHRALTAKPMLKVVK